MKTGQKAGGASEPRVNFALWGSALCADDDFHSRVPYVRYSFGATNTYPNMAFQLGSSAGRWKQRSGLPIVSAAYGSGAKEQEEPRLQQRMARMRRRLVVVSEKGGAGKSTAAANPAGSQDLSR